MKEICEIATTIVVLVGCLTVCVVLLAMAVVMVCEAIRNVANTRSAVSEYVLTRERFEEAGIEVDES